MLKLYFICDTKGCSAAASKIERDLRRVPDNWAESLPPGWQTFDGMLVCPACREDLAERPMLEQLIATKYPGWVVASFGIVRDEAPMLGIYDPEIRWNAFVCPLFGPHAAWRVVQWLNGRQKRDVASMGEKLVVVEADSLIGFSDDKQVYHANEDGLFPLGNRRWGWLVIE